MHLFSILHITIDTTPHSASSLAFISVHFVLVLLQTHRTQSVPIVSLWTQYFYNTNCRQQNTIVGVKLRIVSIEIWVRVSSRSIINKHINFEIMSKTIHKQLGYQSEFKTIICNSTISRISPVDISTGVRFFGVFPHP